MEKIWVNLSEMHRISCGDCEQYETQNAKNSIHTTVHHMKKVFMQTQNMTNLIFMRN